VKRGRCSLTNGHARGREYGVLNPRDLALPKLCALRVILGVGHASLLLNNGSYPQPRENNL
jgi:hypothetical protein